MSPLATQVSKGSKTALTDTRYTVTVNPGVDVLAVLVDRTGKVRTDADLVFFNNPQRDGVELLTDAQIAVDLARLPLDIVRVVIAASTESQGRTFGDLKDVRATIAGATQSVTFSIEGLATETVLQLVAFYRRDGRWRLDAVGQGYSAGLAAFAGDHGIEVDDPGTPAPPTAAPQPAAATPPHTSAPTARPIDFRKVAVTITKDSPSKTASIDLRKGDTGWVLTVALSWDGRGAVYGPGGKVTKYGKGDLDVYFFCRNEETGDYIVISGEKGHRGNLKQWPHIHHSGDSRGPGRGNKPATEQVRVLPQENGDLLVNVYQAVANGAGAIDTFGRPRVVVRYGRPGPDGLPGADADEIVVHVGNGKNSFWATVAHIDVRDGILTVDGETRYSRIFSEHMPGLDTAGNWVRSPKGGPVGRNKNGHSGLGLDRYAGRCPEPR
ncbi:TerD family protein [Nocardia otitidiscaviarum]|uniref:TerD family protein n=1 Tax=Nocardia otitidiscaviarum TaxID=1823 RepID=UPI002455A414|nr:TerD family protein [Nocardia otitidiscaviarum]